MTGRDSGGGEPALPWDDTGLWDFSLAVYARHEVAENCLILQELCSADVNLLLYACWIGVTGRGALSPEDLAQLSEAVSVWHTEVVVPLRRVRRWLKAPPRRVAHALAEVLRDQVKTAELDAERIEQTVLAESLNRSPVAHDAERRRRDVEQSLANYFAFTGATLDGPAQDAVADLVEAVCAA
jgi:uncharacterized protein (TIGR02444 family)